MPPDALPAFERRLHLIYGAYTLAFLAFVLALGVLERMGLPRAWIGGAFLLGTMAVYAGIGILSRTSDATEYYVAGRRVPALYNGMATAADWMSAASFVGMAGTLYLSGYAGLAFVLGWTGGFVLVALLLAPYLRRFGQFTVPDFIGARYGGRLPRLVALAAAIGVSFVYLVAQIYAVGLITARLTGLAFEIGIFVGLGGVLVCSFLGGMRAVTWTQVAQYIVLVIAYLVPVVWLSVKQTGQPVPPLAVGQQLQKVSEREEQLRRDPKELEVIALFQARADQAEARLRDPAATLAADRQAAERRVAALKAAQAPAQEILAAEKALAALPRSAEEARRRDAAELENAQARARPLAGMPSHAEPFASRPRGDAAVPSAPEESRRNFLALVFCLMVGTAALPHVLVRSYTTPSVRQARESVAWTLLFISLLYLTAPALAVLVKYEIFNVLVGTPFDKLPGWIANWSKLDSGLLSVVDHNRDGIFQLAEMRIGADIIVLATPEIAGLPYVISGMVAAGGLAAALSTADGLLLTIANALSHDLYFRLIDPKAMSSRRVAISKTVLLVVALFAAYVATLRVGDIVFLVAAAFSLAAATFFPALVLGVFWKRANHAGCVLGMLAGLTLTFYYMATTHPWLRGVFGVDAPLADCLWWGVQPIAAGVFGVPLAFAVTVVASLLTRPPGDTELALVDHLRRPA
ncbi:cation acetate symporter [Aquabacterium sp. J223]|uniref:cation acetate symporter n=1 Tax=Aquabacterium sp. J223 TaxID=2898431 RepID=UPI0021AD65AA|nr:cation acetate symporter [Aquabacterium sp. J223]UUX94066.1 cation acetate symporter [Aquabacterium sp. J223]